VIASLAQAVALVAHGNVFLAHGGEPPQLVDTNSAFQYVGELRFTMAEPQVKKSSWLSRALAPPAPQEELEVASTTAGWFKHLSDGGVRKLWLASYERSDPRFPSHIAVAFAGFSHWGILSKGEGATLWWRGHDALIEVQSLAPHESPPVTQQLPKSQGNRIWRVVYSGVVAAEPHPQIPDFVKARQEFDDAVCGAIEFADNARLDFWRKWLEEAHAQLDSVTPQPRFHQDMLPVAGYSLESRRLLAAASSAWVFGGMGSWNDAVFDGALKEQYDRVTAPLYAAVVRGIVAATNAFDATLVGRTA
jgi:hypothetical protein